MSLRTLTIDYRISKTKRKKHLTDYHPQVLLFDVHYDAIKLFAILFPGTLLVLLQCGKNIFCKGIERTTHDCIC